MRCVMLLLLLAGISTAQSLEEMEIIQDSLGGIVGSASLLYEELLQSDPAIAGGVTVTFTVSRDGFVNDVVTECDEGLEPVAALIEAAVAALEFGPINASVTPLEVSVPFEFAPSPE